MVLRSPIVLISGAFNTLFPGDLVPGQDLTAQASGNAGISTGLTALASGNAGISTGLTALASGNAGISTGLTALASGNAGISLALTAQASGNAALPLAGGTMTGAILIASGTAAAPGLAVAGDGNSGVFSPGQDQVAISAGGTQRLTVDTGATTSTLPVVHPLGAVGTPSLTFTGDLNTGFWSPTADTVAASTGGSERLRITSAGLVGVGSTAPNRTLHVFGDTALSNSANTGTFLFAPSASANYLYSRAADSAITALPFALAVGSTEALRVDTSGRLLVGTSSATGFQSNTRHIFMDGVGSTYSSVSIGNGGGGGNNTDLNITAWSGSGNNYFTSKIRQIGDGTLTFYTQSTSSADGAGSPTERMRITNNGATNVFGSTDVVLSRSGAAAGISNVTFGGYHSATNTSNGTASFFVTTNGNVTNINNSYGAISDIKLKENIVDASSQWDDLKALQVRNYNLKEGQTHTQIGLVAQEVELVSPGLVSEYPDRDEDGNDLGTVTKSVNYSVLYMKAVKALQEAMERIEQLEADVAALKAH